MSVESQSNDSLKKINEMEISLNTALMAKVENMFEEIHSSLKKEIHHKYELLSKKIEQTINLKLKNSLNISQNSIF